MNTISSSATFPFDDVLRTRQCAFKNIRKISVPVTVQCDDGPQLSRDDMRILKAPPGDCGHGTQTKRTTLCIRLHKLYIQDIFLATNVGPFGRVKYF